ncbi:YtxH domain-containing protein [Halobacillus litoralis]|uniref:YtxH domain-containing protein n=1 Tax=Halobacillus litoralis TaxID=45668 RepID=UPI001CD2AAA1|nr:hypothetical protein [Halobacillus litoralis]MCA1020652.1 hypothetical protein [Halobacillus litoralis]
MTTQQTTKKSGSKKLPIAIVTGALIGGAIVLAKDPEQRRRLKEGSRSKKDSVAEYASEVKENPSEKKDDLVTRVRNIVNIASEAAATVQEVFNNQGKEITDKVKDIKEESEEIVSTAKDAGEELQEVGDKAREAKDELSSDEEDQTNQTAGKTFTPSNTQDNVTEINTRS